MQRMVQQSPQQQTVPVGYQVVILMEKIIAQVEIVPNITELKLHVQQLQPQDQEETHKHVGKLLILLVQQQHVLQKPVLKLLILSRLTQIVIHL